MMEFRCFKSITSSISLLIAMALCSVQAIACLGNDGGNNPYIEPEPVEGYAWEWIQDVVPENIPYWVDGSHWECVMVVVGHRENTECQVGQACDDSGDDTSQDPEEDEDFTPEELPKTCGQMHLDVEAVGGACKLIENNTATSLANGCPNLTYYVEASASIGATLEKYLEAIFGVTLGATYNQQCEARLTFDLNAKLAACEFSVQKMKAAIGPCN